MMNNIEPIDINLINKTDSLKLIDHWLSVLNWPNGWHYDLDIIWILEKLKEFNIKPGASILDAGAGLGVTQFILASMGYNVISLDFTKRNIPKFSKNIFSITSEQDSYDGEEHEYMKFMNYGQNTPSLNRRIENISKLFNFQKLKYYVNKKLHDKCNIYYFIERIKGHKNFGSIRFLRGSFNDIPLENGSCDALVSVSAFEHNSLELMPVAAKEFCRVVKSGGVVLVTTSLAKEKDWYYEPPKGWNLSMDSLKKWFDIENTSTKDFDKCLHEIRFSKKLKSRINSFYLNNKDCGLPFGKLEEAQYLPVAISKKIS